MYTFIEIGSCDFNTLNHFPKLGKWTGVIVDPIKKYLDKIPRVAGVQYINVAITEQNGKAKMFVFKDVVVDKDKDYAGMSTLHPLETNIERGLYEEVEVDTITYATLLERCNINRVDYLKIDTEGHDFEILKQINYESNTRPRLIKVEHKHLDHNAMSDFLISKGYSIDIQLDDIFAISLK